MELAAIVRRFLAIFEICYLRQSVGARSGWSGPNDLQNKPV